MRDVATRRPRLAALALGALSAACLPPLNLVPVLLVAVPGLLWLIGETHRARGAAATGLCFGFGHHVLGLYWITEAILFEAARFWWLVPLAVPLLAAVLALFIAAPCALARRAPAGWARVLVLAGAWTLADLARQFVVTGFPWNPLGSAWTIPGALGDAMIQPAAWIGTPGLTLITLLLAATPALGRRGMVAGAVGLLAWWGLGSSATLQFTAPTVVRPTVVLVQGNVAQGQKWNRGFVADIFRRYLDLTGHAMAEHPGAIIVWPETASPYLLEQDSDARAAISEAAGGSVVLAGTVRFAADGSPRNSLIPLAAGGLPATFYDKWHLVPFGEYQPSWALLPIQLVPGGGFGAGPGPRTLRVPGVPPFGPLICYEAIFPAQAIDRADRPDWMVNITNDAWFGNSTGPRQHLAAARLRAVEEGLPLMRAANTGISAGFDGHGRELGRLGMGVAGTLALTLPPALPPTPFARFGLLIPGMLAALSIGAGLIRPTRRA